MHGGNKRSGSMSRYGQTNQMPQIPNEEWFEVFVSGKGYPYHLGNISNKTIK